MSAQPPVRPGAGRRCGWRRPRRAPTPRPERRRRPSRSIRSGGPAQAILFRHLLFGNEEEPVDTFWSGVSLDLTGATFTGDVWLDRARFAQPPRIRAVWVRLDGRKLSEDETWPPGTVISEVGERPHGVQKGRWGQLVHATKDEA